MRWSGTESRKAHAAMRPLALTLGRGAHSTYAIKPSAHREVLFRHRMLQHAVLLQRGILSVSEHVILRELSAACRCLLQLLRIRCNVVQQAKEAPAWPLSSDPQHFKTQLATWPLAAMHATGEHE